jgi:hypothetical protein
MSAADEIEGFLAESRAADPSGEAMDDEIEAIMRKLYTSSDAMIIGACDEICNVIRRKEFKVHERWIRLLPILWRVRDSFR